MKLELNQILKILASNTDKKILILGTFGIDFQSLQYQIKTGKLYEKELLISEPFLEYEFTDNYAHISITGVSPDPDKVQEEVEKEIERLKENGLNSEDFERIKNMLYGDSVKEFNNVSDIARMFITDYFKGINSFDYLEEYKQITPEYTHEILKKVFLKDKTVLSVVKNSK